MIWPKILKCSESCFGCTFGIFFNGINCNLDQILYVCVSNMTSTCVFQIYQFIATWLTNIGKLSMTVHLYERDLSHIWCDERISGCETKIFRQELLADWLACLLFINCIWIAFANINLIWDHNFKSGHVSQKCLIFYQNNRGLTQSGRTASHWKCSSSSLSITTELSSILPSSKGGKYANSYMAIQGFIEVFSLSVK